MGELKHAKSKIDKLQDSLTQKKHELGKLSGIEGKHADLKARLDEILESKIKAKRVQQESDELYRLSLPCHIEVHFL